MSSIKMETEKGEKEKGMLAKPATTSAAGRNVLDVFCPYCESKNFVKRGTRQNVHQVVQLYLCKNTECGKTFTQSDVKGKKFPLNVIVAGITLYNQGYTFKQVSEVLAKKYGLRERVTDNADAKTMSGTGEIKPDVDTLSNWYEEYKPLCRFERMRPYALKWAKESLKRKGEFGRNENYMTTSALERLPRLLTGHIDIVQIRNGCVHLLDYKPNASKEKPIEQLTWYALALSRLTGLRLFEFKCGWFDEKDYFEFYPLHVVKKLRPSTAKKPRRRMVQFKDGTKVEVPRENQGKVIIV